MKHAQSPVVISFALFALLAACDPADETAPPAVPQNAATPPAAGDPGSPPPPGGGAGSQAAPADYASGEYVLGEDTDAYDDQDPSALTDFHDTLSPYGTWVDDSTYGTVWVPSPSVVGPDFHPYVTAGHWVYDDDWVWASDYSWGWAPFHYGRWALVEGRGWIWVPGRAYRGAWVTWSVDDGYAYVGWAPLPPPFVWFGGVAVAWRGPYLGPRWVYCRHGEVFSPAVGTRIIAGPAVAPVAVQMHVFVPAASRAGAGPAPTRLGFSEGQIPHATGTAALSVGRATQFARPSTAQPLGGHPPSRTSAGVSPSAATRARSTEIPSASGGFSRGGAGLHGEASARGAAPTIVPRVGAPRAAPAFHSGGHFGGGHFGGGGHHR
jgi:hypothetical protein